MPMRSLAILSVLVATLTATGMPATVAAQPRPPDPYDILESSSRAMNDLQAARFAGSLDVRATSGGTSFSMAVSVSGEYRMPDRFRLTMDMGSLLGALSDPSMSGPMEMVVIGDTVWMRMGSTDWESLGSGLSSGSMMTNPAEMNATIQELTRFLPNAVIADGGRHWEIRGDLDLKAALDEGMAMSSMMGMPSSPTSSFSPQDRALLEQMVARFNARIDKASLYVEQVQITMEMPEPRGSGSLLMILDLRFSDFNSPGITIEPPR